MKPFYATILAAALLLTASPLLAEDSKIDMKKLSCKQFSGYDKDNMSIIMMWLEGYTPATRKIRSLTSAKWPVIPRISSFIAATIRTTTSSPLLRMCSARTEG
jgi:hypothetical protein